MSTSQAPTCFDKALHLLALRSHFEAELRTKLSRRGYEEQEIDQTLDRLRRDGAVDDERVAREFAESRRRRKGEAAFRIRQELLRRGVSADLAGQVVAEEPDDVVLERAREIASRRAQRGASEAAIGRYLSRKGYAKRVILVVLEEMRS